MIIGRFDRRIEIYGSTTATDGFGQPVETESLFKTVWAKIEALGGTEGTEGNKVTAAGKVKFSIRYRTGVTEAMQIKFDSEYYDILSIGKPDRKRILEIVGEKRY